MNQPNRKAIKEDAKRRIKGNLWNIWKPLLVVFAVSFVSSFVVEAFFTTTEIKDGLMISYTSLPGSIIELVASLASIVLSFGTTRYILRFIRGEQFDVQEDLLYYFKNNLGFCIGLSFVVSIFTFLWSCLFVIPGIIAGISYAMVIPLAIDGSTGIRDTIAKSKEMMNGHKMDYCIFMLSFFGWLLLGVATCGIALIWVSPYLTVSEMLYYEELKKLSN